MLASLYLSLTEYKMVTPPRFIGLGNYELMLKNDLLFWKSLSVTFTYAIFHIPLALAIALGAALLLNQRLGGMPYFRTIFFLPVVLPAAASSILWWYMFNKDYGLINRGLELFGIEGPAWLALSDTALWAIIIMGFWTFGYAMVIFLAGLQAVPAVLYEAAEIDGGGRWARFRHVTLPMISPVLFFNLIMGTIATFQVFTQAFIMTNGGPANATLFYALYLYNNAFTYLKMGYASALAWALFVIIVVLTTINFTVGRRWVHYGN
ncbi:MAG: sugar ABC transporter permease [Chloroflexi bacterium]|nr:sugar ABC transporter permease [Chloroflexota bacterium]